MIKGISISSSGLHAAVHYGSNTSDKIRLVDLNRKEYLQFPIGNVHKTKTALNINDNGITSIIDNNRILLADDKGRIKSTISIPASRPGLSNIETVKKVHIASYTGIDDISRVIIFRSDGEIIFYKEFIGKSFIESYVKDEFIILRDSESLFCYNYLHPDT